MKEYEKSIYQGKHFDGGTILEMVVGECAAEVISFCLEHGIDYHIKEKTITKE